MAPASAENISPTIGLVIPKKPFGESANAANINPPMGMSHQQISQENLVFYMLCTLP